MIVPTLVVMQITTLHAVELITATTAHRIAHETYIKTPIFGIEKMQICVLFSLACSLN